MRFVISRRVRLVASIATAGLLLVGCGSGPSQAGAAAIIGDTRIPLDQVQSRFDAVLHNTPRLKEQLQQKGQMDELGRQLASIAIQDKLVEQAAQREGLTVDEQAVTEQIGKQGGQEAVTRASLLEKPEDARDSVRNQLLAVELGRKYLDRTSISFGYTQANTRKDAESKAQRMSRGPEAAAAVLNEDRKAGLPVVDDEQWRAADNVEIAAQTPLFGAKAGTVLAFEAGQQSGKWLVARIKDRRVGPPAPTPAADGTEVTNLHLFGMRLLATKADAAEVRLSPRYGVWDPTVLAAVPNENETVGFWFDGPAPSAS